MIHKYNHGIHNANEDSKDENPAYSRSLSLTSIEKIPSENKDNLPEILIISSYPPRECGIATYSQDLIKSLRNKFSTSFSIKVCALETDKQSYKYPEEVKFKLNTSKAEEYEKLALAINKDKAIKIVLIQHEFGFFKLQKTAFLELLVKLSKPVIISFHTVLPHPDEELRLKIKSIIQECDSVIVMTNTSSKILVNDYDVPQQKISVIAHGTHLVPHLDKKSLKLKYGLKGRKVLTTFGLLSSGKSIETTIDALPAIVKECPDVMFLIIGKTHPEVVKEEGEKYRKSLIAKVIQTKLTSHVKFINSYLALPELLEYLQLTDIYLFTSKDPNQAVSGTFVYAMSCACPIISTPIPHAKEILNEDTGIIFDFGNSEQLAKSVIRLLNDEPLRKHISSNSLQKIVSTAWENSAVAHAMLLEKVSRNGFKLRYNFPPVNLEQLKSMTSKIGIIQFSKLNQPDPNSGYTLDDNARALIAVCMHYKMTKEETDLEPIQTYCRFIRHCLQPSGKFLNYVDHDTDFGIQNNLENLDDANGRAIWALGFLISEKNILPEVTVEDAIIMIEEAIPGLEKIHSTRAMGFAIKGLYYYQKSQHQVSNLNLIIKFANRLVQMYRHESEKNWEWYESYLTYANSILPEAMLYAWLVTGEKIYKEIAIKTLDFLLKHTFNTNGIEVISNRNWLHRGQHTEHFGHQPIDVAYTIMTLRKFYEVFRNEEYRDKMVIAFNWFLGKNHLHQIIYNPCTGGCYDGLEETQINLNQGAESTLSYLMARLTMNEYVETEIVSFPSLLVHVKKESKKPAMTKTGLKNTPSNQPYYFKTNTSGVTIKELRT